MIRQATPDDAAAIARVHVDSWRTTYAHLVPQSFLAGLKYADFMGSWTSQLSDPELMRFIVVAEEPTDGIVGFASGGPERSGMSDYSGELYSIYLLHAAQRLGTGRQLVSSVAARLAESGHETMMVWVLADNPSRGFYAKLGGEPIAEKLIEIAGIPFIEAALGWKDLSRLEFRL